MKELRAIAGSLMQRIIVPCMLLALVHRVCRQGNRQELEFATGGVEFENRKLYGPLFLPVFP